MLHAHRGRLKGPASSGLGVSALSLTSAELILPVRSQGWRDECVNTFALKQEQRNEEKPSYRVRSWLRLRQPLSWPPPPKLSQYPPTPIPRQRLPSITSVQGSSCCPSLDLEWQAGGPRPTLSPTWIRTASPSTDLVSASRCSLSLFTYARIYLFPTRL